MAAIENIVMKANVGSMEKLKRMLLKDELFSVVLGSLAGQRHGTFT